MGEDVKKAWHDKFFSEADLKEFAEVGKNYTPETMAAYQNRWTALIDEVKQNLTADPASEKSQDLAKRWTDLLNEAYGGHSELKTKIAKAYNTGAIPQEQRPFGPEIWDFIKRAHEAAKKK